jgi:hypothetical protein
MTASQRLAAPKDNSLPGTSSWPQCGPLRNHKLRLQLIPKQRQQRYYSLPVATGARSHRTRIRWINPR